MARYRFNEYHGVVTNNEEHRTHGWSIGARILDTIRGRTRVWDGSRFMRSEAYDLLIQQGGWDYDGGSGLLKNPTTYGTVSGNFFLGTNNRLATRFLTAAAANSAAGMRIPAFISRITTEPILVYSAQSGNTTATKHFHGFASYTTQVPTGSEVTNPFGNSDSGVMFGFIEGATFKIFHNDGTGAPPTPHDTGVTPVASTLYQFGLEFQSTKVIYHIINLNSAPPLHVTSGEITTRLPPTTTSLAPHWHAESTSSLAINIYLATARLYQRG